MKILIIIILILPLSVQAVSFYDSDGDGLSDLKEKNLITDKEFEKAKKDLLKRIQS